MGTHGILDPRAGEAQFELRRHAPSPDLADVVDVYWVVRWDLRGAPPFAQETLPHPCVHVVVGTHRPGVHGVGTGRFVADLEGEGWVFGVKFRPGGFFPLYGRDVGDLAGRELPVAEVFGAEGAAMEAEVLALRGSAASTAVVERFLRARRGLPDENVALVARVAEACAKASVGPPRTGDATPSRGAWRR